MAELLQYVIAGLKSGSLYALLALGFTIVYAATGAINFAQGEFYMIGGMLSAFLAKTGMGVVPAALAAVGITALIAVVLELVAVRPIKNGDPLRIIMVTIGASIVLRQLALHTFGPDELAAPPFTAGSSIKVLGAAVERQTLWIWLILAVVVCLLVWVYRGTLFGKAMRATSAQRDAARLCGIQTDRMVTYSFAMAGMLGALAGAAVAPLTQTAFDVGAGVGVKGFAAAILGGLGDPVAAVGGGLILGLLESLTAGLFNPLYKDAVALVLLLLVLVFRPTGLLQARRREKV